MKNLISMTDFVLEQSKRIMNGEITHLESHHQIVDYANFLKQPLKLEMFVPCKLVNDVWVALSLPIEPEKPYNDKKCDVWMQYEIYLIRYQQAKERCLFDGFEFIETHSKGISQNLNLFIFPNGENGENRFGLTKKDKSFRSWFQLFTVEDLVQCNIQLTTTAIKKIGL